MVGDMSVSNDAGMNVVSSENMSDLSHNMVMRCDHGSMSFCKTGFDESVFVHDSVQLVDLLVRSHGGMSNDAVELIDKSVVGNKGVHPVGLHL